MQQQRRYAMKAWAYCSEPTATSFHDRAVDTKGPTSVCSEIISYDNGVQKVSQEATPTKPRPNIPVCRRASDQVRILPWRWGALRVQGILPTVSFGDAQNARTARTRMPVLDSTCILRYILQYAAQGQQTVLCCELLQSLTWLSFLNAENSITVT